MCMFGFLLFLVLTWVAWFCPAESFSGICPSDPLKGKVAIICTFTYEALVSTVYYCFDSALMKFTLFILPFVVLALLFGQED